MDQRTEATLRTLQRQLHALCGDIQVLDLERLHDAERQGLGAAMQDYIAALTRLEQQVAQARNRCVVEDLRRLLAAGDGNPLRLHVGSGSQRLPGWINIDAPPADMAVNVGRGLPLPDACADRIFASHVLEHLYHPDEAQRFLRDCARVLQPGGVLRLIVPDAEAALRAYAEDDSGFFADRRRLWPDWPDGRTPLQDTLAYVGAAPEPGVLFEAHRYGYDFTTLQRLLQQCGFTTITRSDFMASTHPELRIDTASAVAGHRHGGGAFSLFVEAGR